MLHYRLKLLKKEKDFLLRNLELLTLNSKKLTFPNFIIIGAQKAGTTWIHYNLSKHKEVYFPSLQGVHDPTEIRYFDNRFYNSLKWYSELYKKNENKILGDKSPGYYFLPKSRLKLIKKLMPDLKVIFIIRNPMERAWSQAVMNLVKFHNKSYKSNESVYINFLHLNINRGMYSQYIKNWQELFPENQFKIYLYDDLKKDPLRLLSDIAKFIGITSGYSIFSDLNLTKKINENPNELMPEDVYCMLRNIFEKDIITLKQDHNLDVLHWMDY